jgi:hypothetical protein
MNDKDKELLAQFHHTISEQLDSRLGESPKFFGVLVIVATGYGYAVTKNPANPALDKGLVLAATLLSLAATFWAAWYLAALGYAFRFLQLTQHGIEEALEWKRFAPTPGEPKLFLNPFKWFWLLPGIYHPHVAGLTALFLVVLWLTDWSGCAKINGSIVGIAFIALTNLYYLKKFIKRRNTGKA